MSNPRQLQWVRVVQLVRQLAAIIEKSGFSPDLLVAVARGGWVPTRLLSNQLDVKHIASIGITYGGPRRFNLECYSIPEPIATGTQVLLIEDILESGRSLEYGRSILAAHGATVRTAALYQTTHTLHSPDYSLGVLAEVPRLPWE